MTIMADTERRCVCCNIVKPAGFFGRTPWGVDSTCLTCRREPPERGQQPTGDYAAAWRMCHKKKGYLTQGEAAAVAAHQTRHEPLLRIYQCPVCTRWHMTHHAEQQ